MFSFGHPQKQVALSAYKTVSSWHTPLPWLPSLRSQSSQYLIWPCNGLFSLSLQGASILTLLCFPFFKIPESHKAAWMPQVDPEAALGEWHVGIILLAAGASWSNNSSRARNQETHYYITSFAHLGSTAPAREGWFPGWLTIRELSKLYRILLRPTTLCKLS